MSKQTKQNDLYFNEWWLEQAIRFAESRSVKIKRFSADAKHVWVTDYSRDPYIPKREPAPIFMMEWAGSNPHPNMTRDEFIVALAKRVERLEAALAEKGGAL